MIGSFGDIVFEVSSEKVRTLDNFQRQGSANYSEHSVIMGKQSLEFTGPNIESVSYEMLFHSHLGVVPIDEVKKLREMRDTGVADYLILDGEPQGSDKWVITDISEKWEHMDPDGSPHIILATVNMKEYIEVV
jgi:Phage protein U